MECLNDKKLAEFLDQELTHKEELKIRTHIEECTKCRDRLGKCQMENEEIQAYFTKIVMPPPLPDSFVNKVRMQINESSKMSASVGKKKQQQQPKRMKKKFIVATTTAATVTLLLGASALVSPSVKAFITSLFERKTTEVSLQQAAKDGFIQSVNKQVTDKGIQLTIHDVVLDPTRISFSYSLKDTKDESVIFPSIGDPKNEIYIADLQGKRLASGGTGGVLPEDKQAEETIYIDQEKLPNHVVLHINVKKLGGERGLSNIKNMKILPDTTGNWQFKIPLDLQKAASQMKQKSIQQASFLDPKTKLKLEFSQLIKSTSRTSLDYQVYLSDSEKQQLKQKLAQTGLSEEMQRSLEGNLQNVYLGYQIVNKNGKVIASTNKEDQRKGILSPISGETLSNKKKRDSFPPLKNLDPYKIEVDHYSKHQLVQERVKLDLQEVKKKPVTISVQGNKLTFKIEKTKAPNDEVPQKLVAVGTFNSKIATDFPVGNWTWVMKDGTKTKWIHSYISNPEDKNRRYQMEFERSELKDLSKPITLELLSMPVYYPVKWETTLQ
ncbi:DUF4179 domain-containing protein [Thermoflavimicrobium daqui]|uniref:Uncharacterized protein n=1 Tax=Thermoflavimicrobium daqui TaxID=2137476 RepID=A0A364K8P8_9BACL|nr:DUF4179 domain-containing protein [Thermoflavimicrobium daqui]RAL26675.1 hypothetical protein DL897_01085 [Thermoflavimicrobium daqui]